MRARDERVAGRMSRLKYVCTQEADSDSDRQPQSPVAGESRRQPMLIETKVPWPVSDLFLTVR